RECLHREPHVCVIPERAEERREQEYRESVLQRELEQPVKHRGSTITSLRVLIGADLDAGAFWYLLLLMGLFGTRGLLDPLFVNGASWDVGNSGPFQVVGSAGRQTAKRLPLPGSLSTSMKPP